MKRQADNFISLYYKGLQMVSVLVRALIYYTMPVYDYPWAFGCSFLPVWRWGLQILDSQRKP